MGRGSSTKVEANKAQCKECKKMFSLDTDKPKHQRVSDLKGNQASCHEELRGMYLKRANIDEAKHAAIKMKIKGTVMEFCPEVVDVNDREQN